MLHNFGPIETIGVDPRLCFEKENSVRWANEIGVLFLDWALWYVIDWEEVKRLESKYLRRKGQVAGNKKQHLSSFHLWCLRVLLLLQVALHLSQRPGRIFCTELSSHNSSFSSRECQENCRDGPICKCFELLQWKELRQNKVKVKDKRIKATLKKEKKKKSTVKLKTPEAFPKMTKALQSLVENKQNLMKFNLNKLKFIFLQYPHELFIKHLFAYDIMDSTISW